MTSVGQKRPREEDSNAQVSRPRKRPGGAARISRVEADAVIQRQQQRAEEARQAAQTRGVEEVVRQHYNAVPQRGREWRKTDSRIKGLRSFNNWIKSTLIHKFSPSESDQFPLRVLDIGCGKGGDLGKWQQAPQPVELYVGIDPAEISIDQARERYAQMRSGGGHGGRGGRSGHYGGRPQRTFDAEFFAEDAFTYSLGDIPIVREVGFGPGSRWGPGGGFDVVSMMFCMHYAFETEAKAKGMLANVAGSLRKGGRFLGVIPNSDVIRSGVEAFHERQAKAQYLAQNKVKEAQHEILDAQQLTTAKVPDGGSQLTGSPSVKQKANDAVDDEPVAKRVEGTDIADNISEHTVAINALTEPSAEKPSSEINGASLHSDADKSPQQDASVQEALYAANQEASDKPQQSTPDARSPSVKRKANDAVDYEPLAKRVQGTNGVENGSEPTVAINVLTEPPAEKPYPEINGASSHPDADSKPQQTAAGSNQEASDKPQQSAPETTVAEWGNSIYRIRFPGETPKDGIFRPPYGWKYSFFMEEAVEEVPEYVVPWEAFRGIAEDYNLELQYRKPFAEIWKDEKNHPVFGPLSERMGVRGRDAGPLLVSDEEMEAASFYHAFCFYKV